MGVTNLVQVLQGNVSFILQDEMPDTVAAFMDDINIKGPPTCYETTEDGWYTSTTFTEPPTTTTSSHMCIRTGQSVL